jgi:hypothetical protein
MVVGFVAMLWLRHDAEINVLRNRVAEIAASTIAGMDRETVTCWIALSAMPYDRRLPFAVSAATVGAILRELTRAYDKEKQS